MGYETYFIDRTPMTDDHWATLKAICGIKDFDDRMKWYDVESNMATLSIHFPETVFCLRGEGEDSPDFWEGFWQNGKMVRNQATVEYPLFDPLQMQAVCDPLPPPPQPVTEQRFVVKCVDSIDFDF